MIAEDQDLNLLKQLSNFARNCPTEKSALRFEKTAGTCGVCGSEERRRQPMAAWGFQPHIIERVLNHVSGAQGGLVDVYQLYEYLEKARKRAALAWGAHVAALVGNTVAAPTNVVQFRA